MRPGPTVVAEIEGKGYIKKEALFKADRGRRGRSSALKRHVMRRLTLSVIHGG